MPEYISNGGDWKEVPVKPVIKAPEPKPDIVAPEISEPVEVKEEVAKVEVKEEVKATEPVSFDLNKDGVVDDKDSTIASKVLSNAKKIKKASKSKASKRTK